MEKLLYIVEGIQRNEQWAMEELLKRFQPLIRRFATYLNTEDAIQELGLCLLNTAIHMPLSNLRSVEDAVFVKYFQSSLYRSYIKISKKDGRYQKHIVFFDDTPEYYQPKIEAKLAVTDEYFMNDPLSVKAYLTEREYLVLCRIILQEEQVSHLAADLHVSRQAINKTKLRALKKLRKAAEWRDIEWTWNF